MYKVYGLPRTRTMRVLWALEELGQEYVLVPMAQRSEEARALNPSGKIPIIKIDDQVVTDSVAIVQTLADRHVALTHSPGTIERARQDAMTQFCVDEVEGALWTFSKHSYVYPEEQRVSAILPAVQGEFERAMATLSARLGDQMFVTGATFTVPDIILTHCAMWNANGPKWPVDHQNVTAYFERNRSRPALQLALEKAVKTMRKHSAR